MLWIRLYKNKLNKDLQRPILWQFVLYCTVLCRWQLCDRLNLLCNQVNVIHTANPMDHANNAMVQPQFINQVQHASVDLSGHNLVNTHQASGIPSPSLLWSIFSASLGDKDVSLAAFIVSLLDYCTNLSLKIIQIW